MSASLHRTSRPFAAALGKAVERWRRINAANAAAFEEPGEALPVENIRLGPGDVHLSLWAGVYLRVRRTLYRRYGLALPLPRAFSPARRRPPGPRSPGSGMTPPRSPGDEERRVTDPLRESPGARPGASRMDAVASRGSGTDAGSPSALSEREWFECILRGYAPDSPAQDVLCGYPSAELQVSTVGCSGPAALTQAFRFWVDVSQACRSCGLVLGPSTRILDFGCGWGRITRFFFRDTRPEHIIGMDVDADFIAICRRIMSGGAYQAVRALPPTDLPPESLDLVVGYSVFSHLSQIAADAWMREFARILKPGGVVAVTTRPRPFLDYCESLAGEAKAGPHLKILSRMFPDFDEARRRYDDGHFLHAPLGGGGVRDSSFYGETFIPEGYAREAWARHLEFREFRFDPTRHDQVLVVLQKAKTGQAAAAGPESTLEDLTRHDPD